MMRAVVVLIACALGIASCEEKEDTFQLAGDATYVFPQGSPTVSYHVDSTIYNPAVGGTEALRSTATWTLSMPEASEADEQIFTVSVKDSASQRRGTFLWVWTEQDGRAISTIDGITILSLVTPYSPSTAWDPLLFADPSLSISVAGEPVSAYKSWSGKIDSTGTYVLSGGEQVDAVWVSLASSENLLELREVREVYGAGVGLLERHMRIFDTQNTEPAVPWEQRAERGFTLDLVRN